MFSKRKRIATKKINIEQLQEHFKGLNTFETADIVDLYNQSEPGLSATAVNWRIFALVQKGILDRFSKGKFRLGASKYWQPEISSKMISLYNRLKKDFPYLKICIWGTSVINEFMIHQPGKSYLLIEVEKEAAEAVFFWLKDAKFPVAMEPSKDFIEKYLSQEKDTIVVKPLVSEAPLQILQGICTPRLEKLLVDIFCDEIIFASQQGAEMRAIFSEAINKYSLFSDRLLRYASRRGKKEHLATYLGTISNYRQ